MRLTSPLRRSVSKLGEMNKLRRYSLALGVTRIETNDYEIMKFVTFMPELLESALETVDPL